ncbi:peptidoglycan-binding domain-containing protein [Streptomyces sp. NPDC047841]|uniref:peptidoglycan-binding domain-containing protein n=1 Tax=Streptomyces sp. NPDC047841 TaxID=3154708 RepID=UPI0034569909
MPPACGRRSFGRTATLTSASDIDGVFGSQTKDATKAWQSDWEASPDGVVGKETFGKAGDWLRDTDGEGAIDTYIGTAHAISSAETTKAGITSTTVTATDGSPATTTGPAAEPCAPLSCGLAVARGVTGRHVPL